MEAAGPQVAAGAIPTSREHSFCPTWDPAPGEGSRVRTGCVPGLEAAASGGTADIPSCGGLRCAGSCDSRSPGCNRDLPPAHQGPVCAQSCTGSFSGTKTSSVRPMARPVICLQNYPIDQVCSGRSGGLGRGLTETAPSIWNLPETPHIPHRCPLGGKGRWPSAGVHLLVRVWGLGATPPGPRGRLGPAGTSVSCPRSRPRLGLTMSTQHFLFSGWKTL